MSADATFTDLARTLLQTWGVPQVDADRLRRFADAVGADDLARIAVNDAALRRLEAVLHLFAAQ